MNDTYSNVSPTTPIDCTCETCIAAEKTVAFGTCHCGCGQLTKLAPTTNMGRGWRKGKPIMYVQGHHVRVRYAYVDRPIEEPNPSGLCVCGCGEKTTMAPYTSFERGYVKGKPMKYIKGHQRRKDDYLSLMASEGPNPSGICQCGCGQTTPLGSATIRSTGLVKGKHARFVLGHQTPSSWPGYKVVETNYVDKVTKQSSPCHFFAGAIDKNGYGRWGVAYDLAHRLAWTNEVGPIPEGHIIHHKCEQRPCINVLHLQPTTRSKHKTVGSRMTWEIACQMREATGTNKEISARFGFTKNFVGQVRLWRVWKTDPLADAE